MDPIRPKTADVIQERKVPAPPAYVDPWLAECWPVGHEVKPVSCCLGCTKDKMEKVEEKFKGT